MILLPSFIKIGGGIEAILRFCSSNLNGCNVGITVGFRWVTVMYLSGRASFFASYPKSTGILSPPLW
jgi:hypothetical protein